jgi:hypothetical protein
MNKVHGKTIFTQNGRSIQKLWQETCFFAENGQLLPLPGTRKKTYLSQSVWSTFAKLFGHLELEMAALKFFWKKRTLSFRG